MSKNQIHTDINNSIAGASYELSSILLAQYDFQSLKHPQDESWCIFANSFNEKFEVTFMKDLIGLAGILRSLLDNESIHIPIVHELGFDQSVGVLKIGDKEEPLSFREACNKIIHADGYQIDFRIDSNHPLANGKNGYNSNDKEFKNPIVITNGHYNKTNWISELTFMKFIDTALNIHE